MSYDEYATSNYGAIPVRLYEFKLGTANWCYAAAEVPITAAGNLFLPMAISDAGFKESGDPQNDEFIISLSASAPMAELFIGTPPSEPMMVVVREMNIGSDEAPVIWTGTYKSAKRKKESILYEIVCRSMMASLDRPGLRLAWGRQCPHALYDRACSVDPADFGFTTQVTSINSDGTISLAGADGYANDWFSGGYLECSIRLGSIERRGIESHSGAAITLLGARDGIAVDQWVTIYPGCSLTSTTCQNKFNNLDNYGGFPHMPNKSLFDGDPVF